jgi:hypothetical protein
VGKFVLWKLKNDWDDYNELYHASAFFEKVAADKGLWIEPHLMINENELAGVVFIIGGTITSIETRMNIQDEFRSLLFKYFHIIDKGKGLGKKWMKDIIFPYYKNLGYRSIYISSSHPKSYPLYEKYGKCIGTYSAFSDNKLFERNGKFFEVHLNQLV